MTVSELLAALAANVTVTVLDSTNVLMIKFVTGTGAADCFASTFLAKEVDTMQLTGNAAVTVKLKGE